MLANYFSLISFIVVVSEILIEITLIPTFGAGVTAMNLSNCGANFIILNQN